MQMQNGVDISLSTGIEEHKDDYTTSEMRMQMVKICVRCRTYLILISLLCVRQQPTKLLYPNPTKPPIKLKPRETVANSDVLTSSEFPVRNTMPQLYKSLISSQLNSHSFP